MKIAFICLLDLFLFTNITDAQNLLTGKEVYGTACKAIVQIYVNGDFSGVGFIVSSDGTIMTANHVITTRESGFRKYQPLIQAIVEGGSIRYPATPVINEISD